MRMQTLQVADMHARIGMDTGERTLYAARCVLDEHQVCPFSAAKACSSARLTASLHGRAQDAFHAVDQRQDAWAGGWIAHGMDPNIDNKSPLLETGCQLKEAVPMKQSKAELLTSATLAVFRLNGLLIHWGDRFSEFQGLTSARWQMLGALALADQPLSAPQIGDRMGVTRQAAQRQLNLLRDEGMVEALGNPLHKRSPLYTLTPQGRLAYGALDQRWQEHAEKLSRHFEDIDLATTLKVLQALAAAHSSPPEPPHAA